PQVLHGWQIGWAREQAESFQAYLRKTKPEAVVDGAWPIKDD
ncbi:MAG: 3'-5' exonuclease, partial [Glutamicibacter protophormiae]